MQSQHASSCCCAWFEKLASDIDLLINQSKYFPRSSSNYPGRISIYISVNYKPSRVFSSLYNGRISSPLCRTHVSQLQSAWAKGQTSTCTHPVREHLHWPCCHSLWFADIYFNSGTDRETLFVAHLNLGSTLHIFSGTYVHLIYSTHGNHFGSKLSFP